MTGAFPKGMGFDGYNAPSRVECDIYDLEVDGTVPDEIDGSWYRPDAGSTISARARQGHLYIWQQHDEWDYRDSSLNCARAGSVSTDHLATRNNA